VFDIWQMGLMPMLFLGKHFKRYLRILIGVALLLSFQVLSLVTKDLGITTLGNSILIEAIFTIDVFIMEVLYFSYSNLLRKESVQ
jgi:hypothetical protein